MSKVIKNKFLRTRAGDFIRMDMVVAIRYNELDRCYKARLVDGGYSVNLTTEEADMVIAVGGLMDKEVEVC